MTTPETIQTILGLVAVAGIGGVWFRLGSLTAKSENHDRRISRLETSVDQLRSKTC